MAGELGSNLARVLVGSPLRRTRSAVAILIVLAVIGLVAGLVFLVLVGHMRADVADVFFRALGLSLLASLIPLAVVRYLDRREREAPWAIVGAFLWGGVIASAWAMPFNAMVLDVVRAWLAGHPEVTDRLGGGAAMLIGAPISAPIVEETLKGLGVVLFFVLLRAEFDNMRDGLIYGALIGIGFNWVETAVWLASLHAEYGVAPWGLQFGSRYALFGLGGHALFTGLFGAGLGLARQTRRRWLQILAPLVGLGLAMAAHAFHNVLALVIVLAQTAAGEAPPPAYEPPPDLPLLPVFLGASLLQIVVLAPFLIVMAIVLWRSGVWERRVIREELRDEIGRAVTREEYAGVEADGIFRTRRIDRLDRRRSAALVNAQHELAFRKRRVRLAGRDPERDALVAAWRNEIGRVRG
jgi:RsiW-degrading membrane proteinase PrsW (M82 family)